MLLNDYNPHDIPIAKELIRSVKRSNNACKEDLKQKKKNLQRKQKEDQKLNRRRQNSIELEEVIFGRRN